MRMVRVVLGLAAPLALTAIALHAERAARDYLVQPVPFTAVHLNDVFWAPRIETEGTWKPLDTRDAYAVATDRFNIVTSEPITTTGLRLELTMQPEFSAGIQEWRVD